MDQMNPDHRISPTIDAWLQAMDKEFSLCANYAKEHGDEFGDWMRDNHPGALLLHIKQTHGACQDLTIEGAGCLYWN